MSADGCSLGGMRLTLIMCESPELFPVFWLSGLRACLAFFSCGCSRAAAAHLVVRSAHGRGYDGFVSRDVRRRGESCPSIFPCSGGVTTESLFACSFERMVSDVRHWEQARAYEFVARAWGSLEGCIGSREHIAVGGKLHAYFENWIVYLSTFRHGFSASRTLSGCIFCATTTLMMGSWEQSLHHWH